jgi:uncharacterized protein YeeX (DUF496 family)
MHLVGNNKAILKIDDENVYEFIIKEEKDGLYLYPRDEINLESIKAIYRNLRENYEYRLRYDEASKFFVREMELRRKYRELKNSSGVKKNCGVRSNLSLTGVYYHLFGYGESLLKLSLTSIGFFGVFSIAYWFFDFFIPSLSHHQSISPNTVITNSTTTAISDMFQIKGQDLKPIDYVIRISSLPILGIFIIALKRRFERKSRH